jgi:hypothetical protein
MGADVCSYRCLSNSTCALVDNNRNCEDGITCTIDTCTDNVCSSTLRPVGTPCNENDIPEAAISKRQAPALPASVCGATCDASGSCLCQCQTADDCDDGNPCTLDGCVNGNCVNLVANGIGCTSGGMSGMCVNATCVTSTGAPTPPPLCTVNADCDDGNDCTIDSCVLGSCVNVVANGLSCTTAANVTGLCTAGSCIVVTTLPPMCVGTT